MAIPYSISALDSGYYWGAIGQSQTLTYSFVTNPPANITGFATYSSEQQAAVRVALAAYSEIAGLTFVETTDSTNVQLRFFRDDLQSQYPNSSFAGYGWYPKSGDVHINSDSKYKDLNSIFFGELLHEIGHALGLKHPFKSETNKPVILTGDEDSKRYTVMSYTADWDIGNVKNDHGSYSPVSATTPMLYDIQAIQYLYGKNINTRTGNDTYTFSNSFTELKAIWDAGGNDTFDLSNQSYDMKINLNEGEFSSLGVKLEFDEISGATQNNIVIAYDVVIENAIGGNGNDTLLGNQVNNNLQGGNGNDTLSGGAGNDTLNGGLGDDTYLFAIGTGNDTISENGSYYGAGAGGNDQVVFSGLKQADVSFTKNTYNHDLVITIISTGEKISISNDFNTDTTWRIESFKFTDTVYQFPNSVSTDSVINSLPTGSVIINDTTPIQNQILSVYNTLTDVDGLGTITYQWKVGGINSNTGNTHTVVANDVGKTIAVTANYTDGLGKLESINSSNTNAVSFPNLTLKGTVNNDTLDGGNGNDFLDGYAGNDVLNGKIGNDTLNGGDGNDSLNGYEGNDVVNGGSGIDWGQYWNAVAGISINLNITTAQNTGGAGVDTLISIENLNGSAFNDTLIGNDSANILLGNAGNDNLSGSAGNDTLTGGAGSDTLTGGFSQDVFKLMDLSNDTIKDFSVIDDTIQLENAAFTKLTASGVLNVAYFKTGAVASDSNDYVIYNKILGALFYDADGNGAGHAVQIALLANHPTLTNADFFVI